MNSQQRVTYCCSNYSQHSSKLAFFSQKAVIIFHYAERLLSELSLKTLLNKTIFKERKLELKKRRSCMTLFLQNGRYCPIVDKSVW